MNHNFSLIRQTAKKAVIEAQNVIQSVRSQAKFEHLFKSDGSPVTEADKKAEKTIVSILADSFPNHIMHGEETGLHNETSESPYKWVFDPIDGTWSFLNYENTASISLCLLYQEKPIYSIVCNPFTNEIFEACDSSVSLFNDIKMPITKWDALEKGVLNYQFTRNETARINTILKIWEEGHIGKLVSQGGSPAYAFAMVAKGAHSAFIMGPKNRCPDIWDLSAGVMLVLRANGQVTDQFGNSIDPLTHKGVVVATTNQNVHQQLIGLLHNRI